MKRARRAIILGVLLVLGGAVVSVLVAEGIGVSGKVRSAAAHMREFFTVHDRCIEVHDSHEPGWRYIRWSEWDKDRYDEPESTHDGHFNWSLKTGRSDDVQPGPPDSLPAWASFWSRKNWPSDSSSDWYLRHEQFLELGIGWPMQSFSMDWGESHVNGFHGGTLLSSPIGGGPRVLLWRPIPLNLALDTLFYAACLATLAGSVRLFVRRLRRRRGACPACGYSLAGLAGGSACPECGAGAVR